MNSQRIIAVLERWHSILVAFSKIDLDFALDQDVIEQQLKERQQIIDALQQFDAELAEIRALKAAGWPKIDAQSVKKIEKVIEKGNLISSSCAAQDQNTLDTAGDLRRNVSSKIGKVRKSKGYLTSSHVVKKRSSIIVDSHA